MISKTSSRCLSLFAVAWAIGHVPVHAADPQFVLATAYGQALSDGTTRVAVDGDGSIFSTGFIQPTLEPNAQAYLAKRRPDNSDTGEPEWTLQFEGTGWSLGTGLAVDPANPSSDVFLSGLFSGTLSEQGLSITSAGGEDGFLARLDTDGDLVWLRRIAVGSGQGAATALARDPAGNLVVGGHFSGTATFGGVSFTSRGAEDVFVAKYSPAGELLWVETGGSPGSDEINAVAVDIDGQVVVAGSFSEGTAYFSGQGLVSAGGWDAFVVKYTSGGEVAWGQRLGGTRDDFGLTVAVDSEKNGGFIHLGGSFVGAATLGSQRLTRAGEEDGFVARLDPRGTALWARSFGGTASDSVEALAMAPNGWVAVAGRFVGRATFGGVALNNTSGLVDAFVGYLVATNGSVTNMVGASPTSGPKWVSSLAADAGGDLILGGTFRGTAEFGVPPALVSIITAGLEDGFVTKLSDGGLPLARILPPERTLLLPADPDTTDDSVTLEAEALGSLGLTYQWFKEPSTTPIGTFSTLEVLHDDSAFDTTSTYRVEVKNQWGTGQDSVVIRSTQRVLSLGTLHEVFGGDDVSVPVSIFAEGTENTVAFSIAFDPALLSFQGWSFSPNQVPAVNGNLTVLANTNRLPQGQLGVVVSLGADVAGARRFPAGDNELVVLDFTAAQGTAGTIDVALKTSNTPLPTEVVHANATILPFGVRSGIVRIKDGYEADLSTRPFGDRRLTAADFVLVGNLVAGLNVVSNRSEFARADCAPFDTKGDGRLSAADWTQAGLYVAGLNGPQETQGPSVAAGRTGEGLILSRSARPAGTVPRRLELATADVAPSQRLTLPVQVSAEGNENAFGFSLNYDPKVLTYQAIRLAPGMPAGAQIVVNPRSVASGRLGVLVALQPGQMLPAGRRELVQVDFAVAESLRTRFSPVTFGDSPVYREAVSASAAVLPTEFVETQLRYPTGAWLEHATVPPAGGLEMTWNVPDGAYRLEISPDLKTWEPAGTIQSVDWRARAVAPPQGARASEFYRLVPLGN